MCDAHSGADRTAQPADSPGERGAAVPSQFNAESPAAPARGSPNYPRPADRLHPTNGGSADTAVDVANRAPSPLGDRASPPLQPRWTVWAETHKAERRERNSRGLGPFKFVANGRTFE